ncbi:histone-fold-containing protein [Lentinula raphanica]|nr:histone-fold-containing protein [Lentinula raphanica]
MPRKENPGPLSAQQQQDLVSEGIDNFELPKSLVTKIAKSAVPDNTKIQKEAILSLVKGSTVFINYLAATAHDVAQSKQHKSISASDVLKALEMIELGDLVDPLSAELQVYRDQVKPDKNGGSSARRASTAGASVNGVTASSASTTSKSKGKEKEKEKEKATAATGPSSISAPGPGANPGGGGGGVPPSASVGGVETLPPPFTSVPLIHREGPQQQQQHRIGAQNVDSNFEEAEDNRMDVDDDGAGVHDQENAENAEMDDVGDVGDEAEMEEGQEGQDEGDGDGDGGEQSDVEDEGQEEEEEELQDMVAVEEEEMRDDARSVEQRGAAAEYKKK